MVSVKFYSFFFSSKFQISQTPNANNIDPCPISPNITPNKNGNVIVVKIDGFISLYLGTPYVSTIYCAGRV
jgi:hypothetical protein